LWRIRVGDWRLGIRVLKLRLSDFRYQISDVGIRTMIGTFETLRFAAPLIGLKLLKPFASASLIGLKL